VLYSVGIPIGLYATRYIRLFFVLKTQKQKYYKL